MGADAAPMTKGAIGGKLLAEHICGMDSELLRIMLSLPGSSRVPPDPVLRHVVNHRLRRLSKAGAGEK